MTTQQSSIGATPPVMQVGELTEGQLLDILPRTITYGNVMDRPVFTRPTQEQIEIVRQSLASAYPESITDTLGRVHPCVPRNAILRGDWDSSQMFRDQIAKLDTLPGTPPDTQGERQ